MKIHAFQAGEVVGTLDCIDPATNIVYVIIAVSGRPGEVEPIYAAIKDSLPGNYIQASPHIDPKFWAGRFDPRFRQGYNEDGSMYPGDSLDCVEPRLFQCARQKRLKVRGMTLGWQGEGENPLPQSPGKPGDPYMKPCPSCEANRDVLLFGVDS
jgi:hypothetical protein